MKNQGLQKLIHSAIFLAMGVVLPFFTGQIKEIGDTLLPMHLPVMLCGFICGGKYGFFVGLILPFFRSVTVGMPPIYPQAVWMSVELATYGLVTGLLYFSFNKKQLWWTYSCLIIAMLCGRITWGITKAILLATSQMAFTFQAFLTGGIIDALPGIILQLVVVPAVVRLMDVFDGKKLKKVK